MEREREIERDFFLKVHLGDSNRREREFLFFVVSVIDVCIVSDVFKPSMSRWCIVYRL